MQDCSNSIALAMELLQSCTKPLSISYHAYKSREVFDISDTETHALMIKNFYTATYLPFIITIVTNVQAKKSVCPENDSTENEIQLDETDDQKFFFFSGLVGEIPGEVLQNNGIISCWLIGPWKRYMYANYVLEMSLHRLISRT